MPNQEDPSLVLALQNIAFSTSLKNKPYFCLKAFDKISIVLNKFYSFRREHKKTYYLFLLCRGFGKQGFQCQGK